MAFVGAPHALVPSCRAPLSSPTTRPERPGPEFRARAAQRATVVRACLQPPAETDIAPPPSTFYQAIAQAQAATAEAFSYGYRLVEVEFPPLPTSQLESSYVGSDEVADANLALAIDFARGFAARGRRVVIAFPDRVEKERAVGMNNDMEEPIPGVRFGCIRDSSLSTVIERIWTKPKIERAVRDDDDMYIVLGASAQELPDVEDLAYAAGDRPLVFFNLKLDTSRGDLGLPAFPRRALHFRFLSKIVPAYYLRTRTYSRSLTRPPYIVNYSGALFRVFPGPYQVLLDTTGGKYKRLAELDERPALGEVRDRLTDGLEIEGVGGKSSGIMYRGYKSTTWWEDDRTQQVSNNWRH